MEKNKSSVLRNITHANQSQPLQLSQHSSASSASQNSVEAQLTQTQDSDDMDQDQDLLPYHSSNGLSSHTPEKYPTNDPVSQSHSDGHHHSENLPVMSQPPSQLQLGPSAALPLSPTSPAPLPTFAVSTPLRQKSQNWYQPPLKRKKRSTCNDSPCRVFSESSQDSSDLSEITTYPPMQTQAPYQSQILTQF
jgi:hypothetical protein